MPVLPEGGSETFYIGYALANDEILIDSGVENFQTYDVAYSTENDALASFTDTFLTVTSGLQTQDNLDPLNYASGLDAGDGISASWSTGGDISYTKSEIDDAYGTYALSAAYNLADSLSVAYAYDEVDGWNAAQGAGQSYGESMNFSVAYSFGGAQELGIQVQPEGDWWTYGGTSPGAAGGFVFGFFQNIPGFAFTTTEWEGRAGFSMSSGIIDDEDGGVQAPQSVSFWTVGDVNSVTLTGKKDPGVSGLATSTWSGDTADLKYSF